MGNFIHQVQRKQREIVALQNELGENEDRVHSMSEHLKNVRQELQHTQGIVNARKNEIETEDHLHKIAQREEGRLRHEIKRLSRDLEDLKEKRNIHEVCPSLADLLAYPSQLLPQLHSGSQLESRQFDSSSFASTARRLERRPERRLAEKT